MDTLYNNADTPPDRLNEDWRYGQPHVHARELLHLLETQPGDAGTLSIASEAGRLSLEAAAPSWQQLASIGSSYIVRKALSQTAQSMVLHLSGSSEQALTLRCESHGLFLPCISVVVEPGVHARIVEEYTHHDNSMLLCLRRYEVKPGASLSLELRETGSGNSRAMHITHLLCGGKLRQISTHEQHAWAREEITAELTAPEAELLLLSANRLQGSQVLDQRTLQRHLTPGAKSRLLFKNVVDDHATAIFGGNIRVETGAHETDAYLSNLNMMLSEQAAVHSLPGLEILADRVRCSHGSATAPMDPEQLFYLLSRGINEAAARTLLAEGFLANVWEQFRAEES